MNHDHWWFNLDMIWWVLKPCQHLCWQGDIWYLKNIELECDSWSIRTLFLYKLGLDSKLGYGIDSC